MDWITITIIAFISFALGRHSSRMTTFLKSVQYKHRPTISRNTMDISELKLSPQQRALYNKIESSSEHMFITGKAGTGKSALLQYFKQNTRKRIIVAAPTGVAALNVGGQTIHSLFKIPPEFITPEKLKLASHTALLLRNIDTLVIDEISMVRADLMDAIDYLLRQARSTDIPFGGVQVVMFGDLYQLPPVVNDRELHKYFAENHGGYYFFNAHAWSKQLPKIYSLDTIFRQQDETFREILNEIRIGQINGTLLEILNRRVDTDIPEQGTIILVTTNYLVNSINHQRLAQIPESSYQYTATIVGNLEPSAYPTEEILKLKPGSQVMFLKNDREKRWVNGSIGHVESLTLDEIQVYVDGYTYSVPPETWNKIRYTYNPTTKKIDEEIISSFTQFPLRLAWAITIHKSQGQTYDSVAIDLGSGAFTHGQTYVALSRCKSLPGLYLRRQVLHQDIMVDPQIINFMKHASVIS